MSKAKKVIEVVNEGKFDVVKKAMADIKNVIKGMGLSKGEQDKIEKLLAEIKQIALVGH